MNTKVFGTHDADTIAQINRCVAAVEYAAFSAPTGTRVTPSSIGGVVAYKDRISISGVGFDIACGNLAIRTDAKAEDIAPKIETIMTTSFATSLLASAARTRPASTMSFSTRRLGRSNLFKGLKAVA